MKGFRPTIVKLCIGTFFVLSPVTGLKADQTWDGSDSNEWSDPDNWSSAVPTAADVANFAATPANNSPTIDSDETFSVNAIDFNASAGFYTVIINGTLTVEKGDITVNSSGNKKINVLNGTLNLESDGSVTVPNGTGTLDLTADGDTAVINFFDATSISTHDIVLKAANGGTINFHDDAVYAVAQGGSLNADINGHINFFDNSAFEGGGLLITAGSELNFYGISRFDPSDSNNLISNSIANFYDNSRFVDELLEIEDGSLVTFHNVSQFTGGTILAENSEVNFRDWSQLNGGKVRLIGSGSIFSGHAQMQSGSINSESSTLDFNNFSEVVGGSILALEESIVQFNDQARMRSGELEVLGQDQDTHLNFNGYSRFSGGDINIDDSNLNFNNHSLMEGGDLLIQNQSVAKFNNDSKLLGGSVTVKEATLIFNDLSLAKDVTIDVNSGAEIRFNDDSDIIGSRINLTNNGFSTFNLDGPFAKNTHVTFLDDTCSVIFNPPVDGTFLGVIEGPGEVYKKSSGITRLLTDSPDFSGNFYVDEGIVSLNAVWGDGTSHWEISDGARLRGDGSILGDQLIVQSGGVLEPGNSPGTLYVSGDVSFHAGSTFQVDIDENGDNGFLEVGGSVSFTNPNTTLLVQSEDPAVIFGQQYHVIHAESGFSGNFDNYAATNPLLYVQGTPSGDNLYIDVSVPVAEYANNKNQFNVLTQLATNADPSSDLIDVLTELNNLSGDEATHALDALTGEQYANIVQATQQSTRRFLRRLHTPGRLDRDCSCSECFAWAEFEGGQSTFDNDRNIKGLDVDHYAFTIGAEKGIDETVSAGVAFTYERENLEFNLNGSGRGHTFQGAIYGVYSESCGYLLGDLVLGYSDYSISRNVQFGEGQNEVNRRLHGSPRVWDFTGNVEAGWNFTGCNILIQPFLGAELGTYKAKKFKEHGGDSIDLRINNHHVNSVDGRFGMRFLTELSCSLQFGADLAYRHRFASTHGHVTAEFREFGDDFRIVGVNTHRDGVEWTAWIARQFSCNIDIYVQTGGEHYFGLTDWTLTGGLVYKW